MYSPATTVGGMGGRALGGLIADLLTWRTEDLVGPWITRVAGLYIAGTTVGGMGGRVLGGLIADLHPEHSSAHSAHGGARDVQPGDHRGRNGRTSARGADR